MKPSVYAMSLLCAASISSFTSYPCFAEANPMAKQKMVFKKNLGDFSYSLALQAADWGLPIVIMYNLRYNVALKPGAKSMPNSFWRLEDITTPSLAEKAGYVTPNVNVIYGFGFFDLTKEPIILEAPDSNNRYYMIQLVDMYTNSFAYVGGVATGYKGGKFAVVGPQWQGELPAGITRIDAPTPWILIQPRVHVLNEADLPAAKKILNEITVKGLAEYTGKTFNATQNYHYMEPEFVNPKLPVSAVDFKDPLQFWKILSAAINENPPPKEQIEGLLPMFKLLGIEFGKQWDPSNVPPVILDSMKRAAQQIGSLSANLPVGNLVNNWLIPPVGIGNAKSNYYLNAIIARVGLTANIPQEAIYFMAGADSNSQPLMSNKKYTLTFKELPPFIAPGFWSITLYDTANNYNVENPIHRYALGSDNSLKMNADGSLTIYVQSTSPGKDKESNWLPSGDGNQPVYLILRSYAPGKAMIDSLSNPNSFTPPPIVEQKE
jgi:DNA sulfur modification protein DndE